MKPAPFEYMVADSLQAALDALAAGGGEAKILAGGQSLMPILNFRLARPHTLIDINRVPGLAFIRIDADAVRIGALTRHFALETSTVLAEHLPVMPAAMSHVAHLAIRNRGTIGGSLVHADPAAELPMLALLLDATLTVRSARASRLVSAHAFFQSALTTCLAPDEMVTEIAFPRMQAGSGWAFEEVARREGDFALAAAAVTLTRAGDRIGTARLALMGVGETPVRATQAEALLADRVLDAALIEEAALLVSRGLEPNSDLHASADYRRHLAAGLVRRVLRAAWARTSGVSA